MSLEDNIINPNQLFVSENVLGIYDTYVLYGIGQK